MSTEVVISRYRVLKYTGPEKWIERCFTNPNRDVNGTLRVGENQHISEVPLVRTMTTDRFNELVDGPLRHPLLPFAVTRLTLALMAVLDATGEIGEAALEEHCRVRQAQDESAELAMESDG